LAGRYELRTALAVGHGRTLWEGHDLVLDRPVGLLVLDRGHPQAQAVRAAAQRASQVEHPHLQRIVDVDDDDGRVFVVTRWSSARTLADTLLSATLTPRDAAVLVGEVADGLAAANSAGVHHLMLDPRDVLVGEGGTTVTGLGVRAAISPSDALPHDVDGSLLEEGVADTRRAGCLLYACLTGRWPGGQCSGLPAAPEVDGRPARPRQVRAGVPRSLDLVTYRALGYPTDGQPSLDAASALSEALDAWRRSGSPPEDENPTRPRIPRAAWFGLVAVASLLAVGVALLGWALWQDRTVEPQPVATPTAAETSPPATVPTDAPEVPIARAVAFDPQGNGTENDSSAPLAIDGDVTTAWQTLTYTTRQLGGLKGGVGLQLRLSQTTDVTQIDLELVGRGTDLEVLTALGHPQKLSKYRLAAKFLGAGDRLTLRFAPPKRADTVLLWLTGLPAVATGYQGGIADVVIRGEPSTRPSTP
jgi:hypothetical protein